MEISIKQGEGISQAIKRQLKDEGVQDNQFTGNVWSKIQQSLNDGVSVIKHGEKETKIGELWTTLKQNVMTYINDTLKIADNTWNKIKGLFNGTTPPSTGTTQTNPTNGTNPSEGNGQLETNTKITLKEKKCDYVETRTKQGKDMADELHKLLTQMPVRMKKVRAVFEKMDKTQVAYVVKAFPNVASYINAQFRLGFGFGKKDVYNFLLKPLVDRAKDLGINVPSEISQDLPLDKMQKYITELSNAIIEKDKATDSENAEYNSKLSESQKRIDDATNILSTAVNNQSNDITKDENTKSKSCKLSDGTSITAYYNDSDKIYSVHIDTSDNDSVTDVRFEKGGVSFTDEEEPSSYKYKNCPTYEYNYNDILALAEKIFGEW